MPFLETVEGCATGLTSGASENFLKDMNNYTVGSCAVGATGVIGAVALTTSALTVEMLGLATLATALGVAGHRVDQGLPVIPKFDKQEKQEPAKVVETTATAA
tara:strand:+ start:52 stop:360 length:309 start_codon:yes stop_codon:yes gene_type:complete